MTISIRGYAKHRKERGLPGAHHESVRGAIADGRLAGALDAHGRIISAEAADEAWAASTREDRVPITGPSAAAPSPATTELQQLRTRREAVAVKLAETELAERCGQLVRVEDVEARWADIVMLVRDKLLGIPSKLIARGVSREVVRQVNEVVRAALEELAGP